MVASATLKELVQFYNRGGNFCKFNLKDLDPDIRRLDLTSGQEDDLVAFLISLTDQRVKYESAPFDRPALTVPNGGILGNEDSIMLPAVGKNGGPGLDTFLGLDPQDAFFTPAEDACNDLFPPEPVEAEAPAAEEEV